MFWFIFGICIIPCLTKNVSTSIEDVYYPGMAVGTTLDWQLIKAISSESRNILISPLSLRLVLALLYEGSAGSTEREFQEVLQFSQDKQLVRNEFKHILQSSQSTKRREYLLNLGIRIFLDYNLTAQQEFINIARLNYQTDIEPTNFSQPMEAAHTINSWVDKLTNGKIPALVQAENIRDDVMLIGNTIYFKGTWKIPFLKNQTKSHGFYVSPNNTISVNYMTSTDKFYFCESPRLDAKILRLPYKDSEHSLFIVLPNSKAGLSSLIKQINLEIIFQELHNLQPLLVEVSIPKFQFHFETSYAKILQDLGLKRMFQNSASFPGIVANNSKVLQKLVVSDIIQKTGIEIDEEGSTIYAASGIQVGNKFGEADLIFNASHPFLFFIQEEPDGPILFAGTVGNPLEVEAVSRPANRIGDNENTVAAPEVSQAQYPQPNNISPESSSNLAFVKRFNNFDLELLKEFSVYYQNVFISPASIKTILAMLFEGSRGHSAQEIGDALRINDIHNPVIRNVLRRLLFDLNDKSERASTLLESSNSVFVSNKYNILPDYEHKLQDYGASIQKTNFYDKQNTVNSINNWINTATHGLIKEIVGLSHINENTEVLLANALYFKGKWETAFDTKHTKSKCFHTPKGCVDIPIMQVQETFNYTHIPTLDADAIELPYQDNKYSMLILVPSPRNNIRVLANDLQHEKFDDIIDQLRPTDIVLELPSFQVEFTADLKNILSSLRIREIFSNNANISGIITNKNVKISSIIQKAKIEVNEQGTKASAASLAVVVPLMGGSSLNVVVNRPFMFFIYQKHSRNIIFEGILTEPEVDKQLPQRPQVKRRNYENGQLNYSPNTDYYY